MTSLLFLSAWSGSGLAAAKALTPGKAFDSWGPVAAILGPLFVAVVDDKRSLTDEAQPLIDARSDQSAVVLAEIDHRSSHPLTRFTEKPERRLVDVK